MRKILFVIAFTPGIAYAQLDRVRTGMTEPEFIKAFPEAHRDYESEAYWINAWDTVEGSAGNSLWRVYNDTISEYSFRSLKVDGPSYRFTTVDSTRVHKLRVSAMKLEAGLEKIFGKPTTFRSKDLISRPRDPEGNHNPAIQTAEQNEIVFAQWVFDDGKIIILRVSTDLSPGNRINAPIATQTQKSESYEFDVTVTKRWPVRLWHFDVGLSMAKFILLHPRIQYATGTNLDHIYSMSDSAISVNARWSFRFHDGKLTHFQYRCNNGVAFGDDNNEIAYNADKFRAEQLLREGNLAFGTPDSLIDKMKPVYELPSLQNTYKLYHLTVAWKTTSGYVYLNFEELGGGKNESVRFSVRVDFTANY